ncbi:hypothetical protein [Mucilaginibacter sp. OK283]|uniref:DUF7009 family protein n=1 Tax=Mucilaginibacter sp. OK283 TaxID=1881049 RepID=UPI0008B63A5D|nr:hypothetical protein [Mucilaginibacter sp. OK283]SEO11277.1 hypothetical protein SAMN05428947_101346 [Mucilaginibacter sp. OK283]
MKIRIKGNSLRYRLTKTDVETFDRDGYLEESTKFGTRTFKYALQRTETEFLTADFTDNTIIMYMPVALALEWTSTNRVGYENNSSEMYLLVEKDFKCLDNVAEDQSDNYPNPLVENFTKKEL